MHFQLPKPLHGWRAFFGEVGIIVLGVLIALGAEQGVEYFHKQAEVREAEKAMSSELRDDNLPQAFTRAAIYKCYSGQLDAIESAVESGDRAKFVMFAEAYRPVFRTWDDEAWKAAVASQVLAQSGSKRMIDWSTPYTMVPLLTQAAHQETDELPQLHARLSGDGPISAAQQDRLFQVISALRGDNRRMSFTSLILMYDLDRLGLTLTLQARQALLSEARREFGECVSEPSPERINAGSQLSFAPADVLGKH